MSFCNNNYYYSRILRISKNKHISSTWHCKYNCVIFQSYYILYYYILLHTFLILIKNIHIPIRVIPCCSLINWPGPISCIKCVSANHLSICRHKTNICDEIPIQCFNICVYVCRQVRGINTVLYRKWLDARAKDRYLPSACLVKISTRTIHWTYL